MKKAKIGTLYLRAWLRNSEYIDRPLGVLKLNLLCLNNCQKPASCTFKLGKQKQRSLPSVGKMVDEETIQFQLGES